MRSTNFSKRRLLIAFIGGILCSILFKVYLYVNDRQQANDSNVLVSVGFVLIATVSIYLVLLLAARLVAPKQ